MKHIIFAIAILALNLPAAHAQRPSDGDALSRLRQKENQGIITIQMDSLVEVNYRKHLLQNYRNRGIAGYRIRIFSDNGPGAKEHQQRTRAHFLSMYPEIPVYYRYEGSYYKVYVGDFRTRNDAMKELMEIQRNFPDAFIVEDDIVLHE
jgi:hypothetical protein